MNREKFTKEIINKTFENIKQLNKTKGQEYSGYDDVCTNFIQTAAKLKSKISAEMVLFIFMTKHYDAIGSYCATGKYLSNETIESRIDDTILYLLLLKSMNYDDLNNKFYESEHTNHQIDDRE